MKSGWKVMARLISRLIGRFGEPTTARRTTGETPPMEVTPPPILSPAIRREAR
jgi:hypothetical protein